jgi:cytochrome c-type biogenesis protein CcmH/NrfF
MWMVAVGVLLLGAILLAIWTARRQKSTSATDAHANDRLGVKDPRDTPWGPPSSF